MRSTQSKFTWLSWESSSVFPIGMHITHLFEWFSHTVRTWGRADVPTGRCPETGVLKGCLRNRNQIFTFSGLKLGLQQYLEFILRVIINHSSPPELFYPQFHFRVPIPWWCKTSSGYLLCLFFQICLCPLVAEMDDKLWEDLKLGTGNCGIAKEVLQCWSPSGSDVSISGHQKWVIYNCIVNGVQIQAWDYALFYLFV